MKYRNLIILSGILIAIIASSFIGIPRSWKDGVVILLGLVVSVLAYLSTKKEVSPQSEPRPEVPPSVNP